MRRVDEWGGCVNLDLRHHIWCKRQIDLRGPQIINVINFDYQLASHIDEISDRGSALIIIEANQYQIYLDDYILLFKDAIVQRYNKKTNQIFIEHSNAILDSIITNFFTTKHFNQYQDSLNHNMIINTGNDNFFLKIFLDSIQNDIDSIQIFNNNNINISLFNIVLSTEFLDSSKLFKLDYPDAFILDLRD
mgnify:CR=1 FL=1